MGVQKNQTLKQLKTQQSKLIGVVDALKIEISTLQKEFSAKTKAVDELQKKIDRLEHPVEVTISEHAILRYFERIESVEMDKIKENILTEKVKKLIDELGPNGTYPTGMYNKKGTEYRVKVVDNVIVTVLS
jgi:predicted RNase H-like nuclease (RuvC/YqgF family)